MTAPIRIDPGTGRRWRLGPRSALPLHAQAEHWLRALIQRSRCRGGGRLPNEVALTRSRGLSHITLQAARRRLVTGGRLERKVGLAN